MWEDCRTNLNVGRLLDGVQSSCLAELVHDGDLIMLICRILEQRERDTVRVTKVNGHADEEMARVGQVRELDRLGDNAVDEAADFGRRRAGHAVVDARRKLSGVCGRWYPVILELHRFFIAISRVVVNHDDLFCWNCPGSSRMVCWCSSQEAWVFSFFFMFFFSFFIFHFFFSFSLLVCRCCYYFHFLFHYFLSFSSFQKKEKWVEARATHLPEKSRALRHTPEKSPYNRPRDNTEGESCTNFTYK